MLSLPSGKYLVLAGVAGLSILIGCTSSESPSVDENEDEVAYSLRSSLSGSTNGKKTYVCHIPPGNPANAHTIHVGNAAVDAHLAHGDSLGACDKVLAPETGSSLLDCHGKSMKGRKSIQNVVKRNGHSWKVTICHIPPGNPANAHTISVGAPAVKAHLAHGDSLGACGGVPETGSSSLVKCPETGKESTTTPGTTVPPVTPPVNPTVPPLPETGTETPGLEPT